MSNNIVPKTRDTLRGIRRPPKAPVESRISAASICPAMSKEKTTAAPNFGIAIKDATR